MVRDILKKLNKRLFWKYKNRFFNKKHHCNIESRYASLEATYLEGAHVCGNTIVTSDSKIGKYSYVNINSSVENAEIGNYCSISSNVFIGPYEHNTHLRSTSPFIAKGNEDKGGKVIIGHDVLISLNAVIIKGVKIGNGAIIGANAVVTKDVEPYEVVGGVPAKHIRYRFNKEEIELIEKTKWWEDDLSTVNKNKDYFLGKTDKYIK